VPWDLWALLSDLFGRFFSTMNRFLIGIVVADEQVGEEPVDDLRRLGLAAAARS
jgi:hypothetical protein